MSITSYPEYVRIKEGQGNVNLYGPALDAFGRIRVSNPFTLFDSDHRYGDNGFFDTATTGTASASFVANNAVVTLTVDTGSGDQVIRETKRVFNYQPGKSLLILNTFVFNEAKTGLRQRVGYFGAENGIFLEQDGTTINLVRRSYVTGSVVDTKIAKANWNGDKLDGNGESGYTLDLTKAQIFWVDVEWLGVGSVRCGFVIDGKFIVCHTFHHANLITGVYMTTATLPIRYEITNTASTASESVLKQICSTVMSEGGYEKKVKPSVVRMTTAKTVDTNITPLITIRLASDKLDSVVLLKLFDVLPIANAATTFEIQLIKNTTLTNDSYDTTTFSNIDFDLAATALSGGTILQSFYVSSSNQLRGNLNIEEEYNFGFQLGRTIAGVSDTFTVAARTLSGSQSAIGTLEFYDLTNGN
jgi:hypothetical protein